MLPEGVASSTARAVLATEAVVFERESLTAMLATDCEVAGAVYGRILGAVCDSVEIEDRDGSQWVVLTKRLDVLKEGGG